jgi:hypothetical protein
MAVTFERAREEFTREVVLTERWENPRLRSHRMQSLLCQHPARFKWCPAGRRSGKTEVSKRDAVGWLITDDGTHEAARIVIGAPTYTRVKDIYFEDLRALIPKHWLRRIKESTQELEFLTHWGAVIRLVGMNRPQVVEGVAWKHGKFDEMADYPPGCFEKHILPAFNTEGQEGSAWFVGVPDESGLNQAEYEKYWEIGLRWPEQAHHCSFWWPSTDILAPGKIAEMAATMDPMTYRQEILGQFVRSGNRAFPSFSPAFHVDSEYSKYSPFLPIDYTLDFGVNPACSLIAQHYGNQIWIMDEIALPDGSTDVAAMEFFQRCGERGYDLHNGVSIFGDAAGRHRSTNIGLSDYRILRDCFYARHIHPTFRNLIVNPEIKDSVNALRTRLSDYRGRATLFIHPRCTGLIQELKSAPWPNKLESFHRIAALRYLVYALFGGAGGVAAIGKVDMTEDQRISAGPYNLNYARN